MATIDITKTFADGDPLLESDLDNIIDDVETFLNTTKINDDNIQDSGITASTKLADGSISTAKLASSVVTTAKILDDAVTAAKIADGAIDAAAKLASDVVTTAKILDSNVTTAKIADSNVTTAKIADSNVTKAKLSSAVSATNTSTTITTTPAATSTITCAGRPVLVLLTASESGAATTNDTFTSDGVDRALQLTVDGSAVTTFRIIPGAGTSFQPYITVYTPSAGSRTFGIKCDAGSVTISGSIRLTVVEL